jgi:pimeloyl-ACP methyl ester carboxylesterase
VSSRLIKVRDREVTIFEKGDGPPTLYLHGFADVHGVAGDLLPFHDALSKKSRLIAPAHPGCNGSSELSNGWAPGDLSFHYLELLDELGLDTFNLVGHCTGGWIAAELAVRHPERVRQLVLIGACGLFVAGEPTSDVFMHAQPERGVDYATLRNVFFNGPQTELGLRWFPNGRGDLDEETRRYAMLRYGSFTGFRPPYFYERSLIERLHRARMRSLVIWGEHDHMVPLAHGQAYAKGLPNSSGLKIVAGAGHAVQMEQPQVVADLIHQFLDD